MRTRLSLLVLIALLGACSLAQAVAVTPPRPPAEVKPEAPKPGLLALLPAGHKVVVTVDARALDTNKALEPLWKKMLDRNDVQLQLANFQEMFHLDLRRDLNEIIFCNDPAVKSSEFILLDGKFDKARVQEVLLQMNAAPDFHGQTAIYALPDEKEPGKLNYISFLKPTLFAFGRKEAISAAIDRAAEENPAAPSAAIKGLLELPATALIRVAIDEPAKLPGDADPIRPLTKFFAATLELNDKAQVKVLARCTDESSARNIAALAEGAAALGRVMLPKLPDLQKLLQGVADSARFVQDGSAVRGSAALSASDAVNALLWVIEAREKNAAGVGMKIDAGGF